MRTGKNNVASLPLRKKYDPPSRSFLSPNMLNQLSVVEGRSDSTRGKILREEGKKVRPFSSSTT